MIKSKAHHAKLQELVKAGKMTEKNFAEHVASTPNMNALPERIGNKITKAWRRPKSR